MRADNLTTGDVAAILDAAENDVILTAFRLMVECGLKVGQVVTLRSLHVSYRGGRFWLDTGRDKVLCSEDLATELLSLESAPELPLVRYNASSIWRYLQRAAQAADVNKKVNTHALRQYWQQSA